MELLQQARELLWPLDMFLDLAPGIIIFIIGFSLAQLLGEYLRERKAKLTK